jgi:hypothetical protein
LFCFFVSFSHSRFFLSPLAYGCFHPCRSNAFVHPS